MFFSKFNDILWNLEPFSIICFIFLTHSKTEWNFTKFAFYAVFGHFWKNFIDEQKNCLWKIYMPAKFHAHWTKNKVARANWIFNYFFYIYLAFANNSYNLHFLKYIGNVYVIKLYMHAKLFVIWLTNKIVMICF